tara:strand:- start:531 stop:899 length:369 start_codon:yes stop_codon:yes gene_type:complete
MLLGLSGLHREGEVTLDAINGSTGGDGGVMHGRLLVRLVEAMWEGDPGLLTAVCDDLLAAAGADVLVDAVAVSANFHMMTRVADGTGTPLDPGTDEASEGFRHQIGVNDLVSRRHVPSGGRE